MKLEECLENRFLLTTGGNNRVKIDPRLKMSGMTRRRKIPAPANFCRGRLKD
jgi:hypothetical protein